MDVGEFITQGADRTWQWFLDMSWWEYVLMVAFILVTALLIWSFFRHDEAEEAGPVQEVIIPDDYYRIEEEK